MANCVQCGRKLPALFFGKKICAWCVRHEAAQRGEEPEDAIQPVMPTPWAAGAGTSPMMVTQALLALNIGVFVIMALNGVAMNPTPQQLVERGANYGPLTLGGQEWRLVSSMFLHGGFLHILFNMWCLWDLGQLCESLYGHATFAAVYLISGIAASLASVWWHPAVASVGASGAIFGVVGALIASYYLGEFSMPRFAVASHLRSVLIFAGYSLIFGAMSGHTDNAAHIGGLVTGLAFGALIARYAPGRDVSPRTAVVLAVALAVLGCGAWLEHSRSYLIHSVRGGQLLEENQTNRALVELQTAIRQRPDYVPAHYALADAYFRKKQYAEAERELKRVIELQPAHEPARFELGIVYLNAQRTEDAKAAFRQLLAMDGDDAYAHFGLGRALAVDGDNAGAVGEYRSALQLGLQDADLYYHLGVSQANLNDLDQAIGSFLKSLALRGSDDFDTETALAAVYRAKGMGAEADAAIEKAEKLPHDK
jgi:membrane associated rhomboid family serine protease/Flp pilus assembly protein TadD